MCDIYPETCTPEHVAKVIVQLDSVAESLMPLMRGVLQDGRIPDDEDIDRAFGL